MLGEALARFGVDVRDLTVGGDYADAFGPGQPFTAEQRAAFAGWMDRIYEGFVQRVAAGRKLPPERVREIAKGRVWTGAQARSWAWSTSWAASTTPWPPPSGWRACPPTRTCGSSSSPRPSPPSIS